MADASSYPLPVHDSNFDNPDVTSNQSTTSNYISVLPDDGPETSPSMPSLTPSRSQTHSTAAYASPENTEDGNDEPVQSSPVTFEFNCPHCREKRASRALLNKHIKTHTQPYRCGHQGCAVGKATQRDLDRHQDTHGKIRRYFCPVYGCAYDVHGIQGGFSRRLDNAKRHLKTTHDNSQGLSVLREDSQGRLERV
ncbi:uncharacterized protein LY89DRAFT_728128 [Mollisia scopiformis]|uniref:C2H2-type domain-containing protein n=1 Tax=Mollisia scopiformis TaxID=149040 RepID=A0A194XSU4_MOLSC|nr:uncharacterized protein LY89DRAFT_728128 [Mollisia scopiformis]KUJ23375.1 hypothetical protein LY89DRAFT_728128 [Mollisia scopiformis]